MRCFLVAFAAASLVARCLLAQPQDDEWRTRDTDGWRACIYGKYEESERLLKEAVQLAKKSGNNERRVALSLAHLAVAQQRQAKLDEAEQNARAAQITFSKTKDALNTETVRGTHTLGEYWQGQRNYGEAERLYDSALKLARYEKVFGEKHPIIGQILCNLASVQDLRGKFGPAEANFRNAFAILEKADLGEDQAQLAKCYEAWAQHYKLQGNYAQAAAKLDKALETARATIGAESPQVAHLEHELGTALFQQRKFDQAVARYQAALALREKAGNDSLAQAQVLHNLAIAYMELKKLDAAQDSLNKALQLRQKDKGGQTLLAASTIHALGELALARGQPADAEKRFQESLAIKEKLLGANDVRLTDDLDALAQCARKRKDFAQAEKLYQRALDLRKKERGANSRAVAATLHNLANLYREQGKSSEAEPLFKQALAIREKALGPDDPLLVPILRNYAELLKKLEGRAADVQKLEERVKKIETEANAK